MSFVQWVDAFKNWCLQFQFFHVLLREPMAFTYKHWRLWLWHWHSLDLEPWMMMDFFLSPWTNLVAGFGELVETLRDLNFSKDEFHGGGPIQQDPTPGAKSAPRSGGRHGGTCSPILFRHISAIRFALLNFPVINSYLDNEYPKCSFVGYFESTSWPHNALLLWSLHVFSQCLEC